MEINVPIEFSLSKNNESLTDPSNVIVVVH